MKRLAFDLAPEAEHAAAEGRPAMPRTREFRLFEQALKVDDDAGARGEEGKERALGRRELNRAAVDREFAGEQVEGEGVPWR